MKNPGYIFLDGGGIDLSSSDPQLIAGAWNRTVTVIKTGKPLTPVPVFCWYLSASSIVIVGATLHIIVTNDDYCVVQDVAPTVEAKAVAKSKK